MKSIAIMSIALIAAGAVLVEAFDKAAGQTVCVGTCGVAEKSTRTEMYVCEKNGSIFMSNAPSEGCTKKKSVQTDNGFAPGQSKEERAYIDKTVKWAEKMNKYDKERKGFTSSTIQDREPQSRKCTVSRVIDGDTVVADCGDGRSRRVRYAGINAPERGQAYGSDATSANRIVQGSTVDIKFSGKDAHGRDVGSVSMQGKDISEDLVRQGLARSYGSKYASAERSACLNRVGLWRDFKGSCP